MISLRNAIDWIGERVILPTARVARWVGVLAVLPLVALLLVWSIVQWAVERVGGRTSETLAEWLWRTA